MDSFGAKASLGLCLKQFEIFRGEILISVYFGVVLANSPGGNCKKWMRKKPTSGASHSPEAAESKNFNDWFVLPSPPLFIINPFIFSLIASLVLQEFHVYRNIILQ